MEYKYDPYFMDRIRQDLMNKGLDRQRDSNAGVYDSSLGIDTKPLSLNAWSDGQGNNIYTGNIKTEGKSGTGRYNYGLNISKVEGQPIGYGIYGGVSNPNFGVQANAGSGGYGVSGYYVPYGLNASYQNNRGQKPNITIGYQKGYNF